MSECGKNADVVDALNKAEARIAELSQAVGLITTLKPTMVMDANHPLDMVREVAEHVTARIAELEAERRWIPVSERLPRLNDVATPIDVALRKRIAELEAEVTKCHELQDSYCDRIAELTAHSDIERQDDKSSNDTQTQTIVYGKESEE